MGTASSKATNITDVKNFFKTDVTNALNLHASITSITKNITDISIDAANTSAQSSRSKQVAKFSHIKARGDVIITNNMDLSQVVDFSSLQMQTVRTKLTNKISQVIKDKLISNMSTGLITKIMDQIHQNANATTASAATLFPFANSNASTENDTKIDNTVLNIIKNTTNIDIDTVIKTIVKINLKEDIVNTCYQNIDASQYSEFVQIK